MDAIRNCCHAAYTYPISRQRLLIIGGGILCSILVGTLLIVISSDNEKTEAIVVGRDALLTTPLIIGNNALADNLKTFLSNHLKDFNFTDISANIGLKNCTKCATDLNRLVNGMVSTQVWTVTSSCLSSFQDSVSLVIEQIDVIKRLISMNPGSMTLEKTSKGIQRSLKSRLNNLVAVAGGHTIDSRLSVLRAYYDLGVRIISLGNNCGQELNNNFSIPWYTDSSLTDFGKIIIKEMNRMGMIIDIAKLPKLVQLEVLTESETPVIIGNVNAKKLSNSADNIEDDVLQKLKEKNGLIMISFSPELVNNTKLDNQTSKFNVTLKDLIAQINYIRNITGPEHIGIGGGFDGFNETLQGLEDTTKIPNLFDSLYDGDKSQTKWSIDELQGFAGLNFLKLFDQVEKQAWKLQLNAKPYDDYEPREELEKYNHACYSDFDQRYPNSVIS